MKLNPKTGVYVDGLSSTQVFSAREAVKLIKEATERRTSVPTTLNPSSSRSHLICTLKIFFERRDNVIVQFVDLAGRESLGEEHGFCKTLS